VQRVATPGGRLLHTLPGADRGGLRARRSEKKSQKNYKKNSKKKQGNAWLYLAAACRTRYLALIEEDFVLVEALPRSSALLRSAAALLAHHSLGAFLRRLCSGAMKAL
jgi:hypothetical protein